MTSIHGIKRRLEKVEARGHKPDDRVAVFFAWDGDPCLGVDAPWPGLAILRIILTPAHQPSSDTDWAEGLPGKYYGDALKEWEAEHGPGRHQAAGR